MRDTEHVTKILLNAPRRLSGATLLLAPVLAILFALPVPATYAADGIRTEKVQFAKGASSAVVNGQIRGAETVDYVLRASKGQLMNVSMATDNGANYFNILAPGETDVAFFNGSMGENQYEGALPASAGSSQPAAGASTAAKAGAGRFDATGKVPCARSKGQPMSQCDFGVTRGANGDATVIISGPDGSKRAIFFAAGKATGADTSQADGPAPFSVRREGDLNLIRVGDERYEIPDAAVFGG